MEPWPQRPVPVFPLSSVVLFPHVAMPLHIFELRYRTMVRDALSADRHVAMALLKPGWESDYHGSPEFHPIVCLGTIAEVEWLPNDCYDLSLRGVARARVTRVAREFPYRAALLEPLPQHPYAAGDPLVDLEREALLEPARTMAKTRQAQQSLAATPDLETVANHVCTFAAMDPRVKLALLEEDSVIERARRIREWLETQPPGGMPGPGPKPGGEHN